jgi:hypothetical protein
VAVLRSQPRSDSALDLADWLELQLIQDGHWFVTEENARSFLESVGLFDSMSSAVPGAVLVLHNRARRLKDAYILGIAPGGLRFRTLSLESSPYLALLCLSLVDGDLDPSGLQMSTSAGHHDREGQSDFLRP